MTAVLAATATTTETPMSDANYQQRAGEFLDLWQQQARAAVMTAPGATDSAAFFSLAHKMAEDPAFAASVQAEAQRRLLSQMQGIQSYCLARYERKSAEPECVWQTGNCRLLDYTVQMKDRTPAVLLIPSLINRYYILDLTETTSFARYLAARGFAVYLVDWGLPGEAEKHFDSGDYVTRYLSAIGEFLRGKGHIRTVIGGHCMGGMLALAIAALRPDLMDALALFATPWDFAADPLYIWLQDPACVQMMERYIQGFELFPGEHVLAMFYLRDPWLFQEKLEHFHDLMPGSEPYDRFLAVEHWANGCVPLAQGVAKDGFLRWGAHNEAMKGAWRVGGRRVAPQEVRQPALVVTPRKDRIVPYLSALPLATSLPNATHLAPDTGHIGMIVGSRAREHLWEPFAAWATNASSFPT